MGFIKNLLHRLKKSDNLQTLEDEVESIGEKLDHDSELIAMLENDHQELFEIYHALQDQFKEDNDFSKIKSLLDDFKVALEIHLMVEKSKLYNYIRSHNQNDEACVEFVDSAEDEMKILADEILAFIQQYSTQKEYEESVGHFLADLSQVGVKLSRRIIMEESKLYTLYKKED